MKFKHEDYLALKDELGFGNADIANIVGLKPSSVKNQTQPKKAIPTWVKGMLYMWKHGKKVEYELKARLLEQEEKSFKIQQELIKLAISEVERNEKKEEIISTY